jgi:uncharacterized protein YegJ (DUF2314 family)
MLSMARSSSAWQSWLLAASVSVVAVGALFYWTLRKTPPVQIGAGGGPPGVTHDDPRVRAADAEAKQRWGEFLDLWEHRRPGQQFFVKGRVTEGYVGEWLWIRVTYIGERGNTVTGDIDAPPTRVRNVHLNDTVIVSHENISDWIYYSPSERRGGFTIKALDEVERQRAASRKSG